MSDWFRDIADFFFPRSCMVCGRVLLREEKYLCSHCRLSIPRTEYCRTADNAMAQLFYGRIPVERCAAYFFFTEGGDFRRLIHRIKYYGERECGCYLGQQWAIECRDSGFFDGIDFIVPVPLHRSKLRKRGYNQSEWIAQGIADATGVPLCLTALECHSARQSQTRKGMFERWQSTRTAFTAVAGELPEGSHVLLVDDVVTTGATLLSCAEALLSVGHYRISMATLAAVK